MFRKKNVLVTGGSGFIGTNLILRLLDSGANIRATIHNKKPQISHNGIEFLKCDLTNEHDCHVVTQDMDYVFMCAANTSGAAVIEKSPLVHVTPNIIMNTLMLDAAYKSSVKKFLFISTNAVYPVTDHPVKEEEGRDDPLFEKYFCVGWMKRFSEIMCEMYASKIKKPMQTIVIRPGNCYGPYDDFEWETAHVLPALIRRVVERHSPIEVWGDGGDVKDFIYVNDLVCGMILAMEKYDGFQSINIASGKPISIKESLEAICLADEYLNAEIVFDKSKPTMIPKRLIDVSKAKKLLRFESTTPFELGIKNTTEWYKKYH